MPITFTEHPIIRPPTDEEIVLLGEQDPKLLAALHEAHEGRIQAAEEDPIRYGFDLAGWDRIRTGLRKNNEVLALGGNRSGKTTGCARCLWKPSPKVWTGISYASHRMQIPPSRYSSPPYGR